MNAKSRTHVLLIDHDRALTKSLGSSLQRTGYQVSIANDGHTGLSAVLIEKPDIIVLEVMIPGLDGWQLCEMIRQYSSAPILILTAQDDPHSRIKALDMGADDYHVKPLSFEELEAHIRAILRRVQFDWGSHMPRRIAAGRIVLNSAAHTVTKDGLEISMRLKEFRILALLMANRGKVVTREHLFGEVWGADWFGDTRTLDVHMSGLRAKLEDDPASPVYLQTVRGVGYRFNSPEEDLQRRKPWAGASAGLLRKEARMG